MAVDESFVADAAAARERPVGWLVVAGQRFPVARLELARGRLWVVAVRTLEPGETLTLPASTSFGLLGVDEWPVLVGPYWVGEPVTARADEKGPAYYRIELPLRMTAESVIVTGPDDEPGVQVTIDPH